MEVYFKNLSFQPDGDDSDDPPVEGGGTGGGTDT